MTDETNTDLRPVGWNDRAILAALGTSPANVRAALMAHKQGTADQPSDWAIYQWTSRGKIASEWRPRLLYVALRTGRMKLADAFMRARSALEIETETEAETKVAA